jgi:hypothetical protein
LRFGGFSLSVLVAPPTHVGDANLYYTIPPAICQEKNRKKIKKNFFPKTLDKSAQLCYNVIVIKRKKVITMAKKKKNNLGNRAYKKTGEELQQYLHFRKRGSVKENGKGKGSYNRQKFKKFDD